MRRFFCAVDGPAVVIEGETFLAGLELVLGPVYGRVLFTAHGAVVRNCFFGVKAGEVKCST